MNYRNFVIDSCGLRLLDFLGSFSFIALTSDEHRFNFNPILFGTCSLYNTKYEYAIKPVFNPDLHFNRKKRLRHNPQFSGYYLITYLVLLFIKCLNSIFERIVNIEEQRLNLNLDCRQTLINKI